MPSFADLNQLIDIDKRLANDEGDEQLVIKMARILEQAGGEYVAERLLQRVVDVDPAEINDLKRARSIAEVLRHRARLVRKIRKAIDNRIKELGG